MARCTPERGSDAARDRRAAARTRGVGARSARARRAPARLPGTHPRSDLCFGIGPAGTGKTYLAVACAVEALQAERVRRIVLVRPAVEAGERLGFLPGDMAQKVDPYLRPMYDALYEMMGFDRVARFIERNVIEVAPLAFMRGRSLNDSFIILDEAQNTTIEQMKMFLTRIGFGSRAVVTGDVTQTDLPSGRMSGLRHARLCCAASRASPSPSLMPAMSCAIRWCSASCRPTSRTTPADDEHAAEPDAARAALLVSVRSARSRRLGCRRGARNARLGQRRARTRAPRARELSVLAGRARAQPRAQCALSRPRPVPPTCCRFRRPLPAAGRGAAARRSGDLPGGPAR